jgi:hypothetical protein
MPPLILVIAGAVCGGALMGLAFREVRRINDELERVRSSRMAEARIKPMPRLRQDPRTGAYRPE